MRCPWALACAAALHSLGAPAAPPAPRSTSTYVFGRHHIVGPGGWSCRGSRGFDGTVLVLISRPRRMGSKASVKATVVCEKLNGAQVDRRLAGSTEHLRFDSSGACVGCALSLACEFFESAAKEHKEPPVRGAVFYRPEGDEGIFAARLECRAQDASVCRESLSFFRAKAAREAPRRHPQRN